MKTRILLAAIAVAFPRTYAVAADDACTVTPSQVVDFANRDSNRITGNIAMVIARKAPYINVLEGGVLENVSDTVRAIVQERAYLGHSLTAPVFTQSSQACGTVGQDAQVGSTEFTETLGTLRGRGPRVCVKTTRTAFTQSYAAAEDALKKQLVQLNNADVRAQLVNRSGCKLVVNSTGSFEQMFDGGTNAIDTAFPTALGGGVPNAAINFTLLKYLGDFLREDLLVEPFEDSKSGEILRFIGSQQILQVMRNDLGIKNDFRAITTGQWKVGKDNIDGYSWEGPYQGITFGIDSQPLRFSNVDGNGQPIFIEPEIAVATTKGVGARINPAWARARYEVGILMGMNSFRRRVPKRYMGAAGFKFPPQLVNGELEFAVIRDNACNQFQDFGQHLYQIERSYRPERPHSVCAIAYKRCAVDFGLTSCTDYPNYSSTDSL